MTIPGFIHQWLAARELEKSIGFSISSPYKSVRYWLLRAFFWAVPIILFWLVVPLVFRIEPFSPQRSLKDWGLWGIAIALGFSFPYFLNAPFSLLAIGQSDVGPPYKIIVDLLSITIRENYRRETDDFWAAVGDALRAAAAQTNKQNYRDGHAHLIDRLVAPASALNQATNSEALQIEIKKRLEAIAPRRFFQADISHEVVQLFKWLTDTKKLTRRELPAVLTTFGCYQCAQRYFPKATKGSRLRR
jgi:hypothetical protein